MNALELKLLELREHAGIAQIMIKGEILKLRGHSWATPKACCKSNCRETKSPLESCDVAREEYAQEQEDYFNGLRRIKDEKHFK